MLNLSKYCESRGHEIQYFGMEDSKNIVNNMLKLNVKAISFNESLYKKILYPIKIIYSFEARNKLEKVILAFKPDIVHINNYNYQITPSILYVLKKYNIPIVQTLHDPQLVCPYHRLYNYKEKKICEKCRDGKFVNCVISKCIDGSFFKSLVGALESILYRNIKTYDIIDYYITPSKFLKNKMLEMNLNISREKFIVLHNFIDNFAECNIYSKKDYVIYFGRLSSEKGIDLLIEATRFLPHIKFIIVGEGDLNTDQFALNNVEFVGFKTGEDLKSLVSNALISVYPSEWYENCPMSILESQMYGTPVIGTNKGGITELIEHEVDGLLFEPGNIHDLAEKIAILYDNRELLNEYTINCIKKVKKFSVSEYYNYLLEIYTQAINRHKYCEDE